MERKGDNVEKVDVEDKEDNKFVLEYPEDYNEIVEGMLRKVERECEYIKKFEIKEKDCNIESKGCLKEENNSDNDDNDEGESNDNDKHHYIALDEENDDDDDNKNINNNSNEYQTQVHNNSVHDDTNTKLNRLPQHITQTPPTIHSLQPEINSSKIKQMLSRINIPPPSWASSLSDEAFLNLILPSSLKHPSSSN